MPLFLGLGLAIETAILLVSLIVIESKDDDLTSAKIQLGLLHTQAENLKADIAALTQARLPGLDRVEFDKVIPLDRECVKSIAFNVSEGGERSYDYKLVLQNEGSNVVHVLVKVSLFDAKGIQVGDSQVGAKKEGSKSFETLDRGEIRSFFSKIELTDGATPQYFRLAILKTES